MNGSKSTPSISLSVGIEAFAAEAIVEKISK
jgi:hypothetical protein